MEKSLFYPSAVEWMWDYCIFLGSYISKDGTKYDLGIFIHNSGSVSAAIVYGDVAGNYLSGELEHFGMGKHITSTEEIYEETRRRASNLGYYNGRFNPHLNR